MKNSLKISVLSILFAAFTLSAQALAVGVSCLGGNYAVSLNDQNYIMVSNGGYLKASGIASQSDQVGWQYLAISQNVGPQPQDINISYTLVVPAFVGNSLFTGFLDVKLTGFGTPGRVTRNTLVCTPTL